MKTIAVIPARGGSQRIPGKNIKQFHGKPIIVYSIEAARASQLFDQIIVTTDDGAIADVASRAGAWVFRRHPAMAHDDIGTQEVVRDCLLGIKADDRDIVCCIYPTAPLMSMDDLIKGFTLLYNPRTTTFVFSVGYPPLHDAGQFYWGRAVDFIQHTPLVSQYSRMICVDPKRDCDINTPYDWQRAVEMYEALRK